MILLEVKDYIKQHKLVNLQDLALYFQRDPDTMREIVGHWLRKGIIRKVPKPTGCGVKCGACKPSTTEVYCALVRCDACAAFIDLSLSKNCPKHTF